MKNQTNKPVDVMANATKMLRWYDKELRLQVEVGQTAIRWMRESDEALKRAIGVNETFQSIIDVQDRELNRLAGELCRSQDNHKKTAVTCCGVIVCMLIVICGMLAMR